MSAVVLISGAVAATPAKPLDGIALTILIVIFVLVAVMGFLAAR